MPNQILETPCKILFRATPSFDLAYIRTTKDYYIRESDGILLGYLERGPASSGKVMNDRLADTASIAPIPPEEFSVSKVVRPVATKSLDDAGDISTANMIKAAIQKERRQMIIRFGFMTLVIAIPVALLIFFFQKNSNQKD